MIDLVEQPYGTSRLWGAESKRAKEFTVTTNDGALHAPDDIGLVVSEVIHAP